MGTDEIGPPYHRCYMRKAIKITLPLKSITKSLSQNAVLTRITSSRLALSYCIYTGSGRLRGRIYDIAGRGL